MRVLIYGCGALARRLAVKLAEQDHEVTLLGHRLDDLALLAPSPRLYPVWISEPLMQDYLREGGIFQADALLALSEDDHANALAAQVGLHIFHVPQVACHLSDSELQKLYTELGLRVVGPAIGLAQELSEYIEG